MLVLGIETTCDEDGGGGGGTPSRRPRHDSFERRAVGRLPNMRRLAAWYRKLPPVPMSKRSMLSSPPPWRTPVGIFGALDGVRGGSRAGADRRGHRRTDHGQGHCPRPREAADCREPPEAHALTARLTDGTPFPYCLFLASGGTLRSSPCAASATMCALARPATTPSAKPSTRPQSCSGSANPGGPRVEQEALRGDGARFTLPRPMIGRQDADFSLSGLKTALRLEAEKIAPLTEQDVADLCARSSTPWWRR